MITTSDINDSNIGTFSYYPEEKPEIIVCNNKKYRRDPIKAQRAIVYSDYKCNIDKKHKSFVTKNGKLYMEAHHLIPLST